MSFLKGALALFCILPLVALYWNGIQWPEDLPKDLIWEGFSNSLVLLILGLAGATVIGGGGAGLLFFTNPLGKKLLRFLFLGPLIFPSYVLAFLYMASFPTSHFWQSSRLGLGLVLSMGLSPYVFLFVTMGLHSLKQSQWEVHQTLGRSFPHFFFKVVWPQVLPFYGAALFLVGFEILSDFGAASLFNVTVFTTLIYKVWFDYFSFPGALGLTGIFGLFIVVLILFEKKIVPGSYESSGGQSPWFVKYNPRSSWFRYFNSLLLWGVGLWLTVFPLMVLCTWVPKGLQFESPQRILSALLSTTGLACVAGFLALVLGAVGALVRAMSSQKKDSQKNRKRISENLSRNSSKNASKSLSQNPNQRQSFRTHGPSHRLSSLSSLGYAFPGVFLAVGWVTLTSPLSLARWSGFILVALALAHKFMSVADRALVRSLQRIPKSWSEYHSLTGQPLSKLVTQGYWPPMKTGVLYGFLLVAIEVSKEMPLTLMLLPSEFPSLSVQVFNLTSEGEWGKASVYSLALVAVGVFSLWLSQRVTSQPGTVEPMIEGE